MRRSRLGLVLLWSLSAIGLTGCRGAPDPLPAVAWSSPAEAKRTLIDRRDAINTVQAECDITIERSDGERQTFDGAVVMQQPDSYRLRAWKLTQTLFDLTVNEDGVWIAASEELLKRRPEAEADLAQLADQLGLLLRGPDYAEARMVQDDDGLIARWPEGSAIIDPRSLTPRRFLFEAPDSGEEFEIRTRYEQYAGGVWYDRVVIEGGFGQLTLKFRNVEVNAELNPRAFKPPRRAKQP